MKKIIISLLLLFNVSIMFAQDVRLNDSVIFINNKPVALYAKFLSPAASHFNIEVYSFDDYVLIKAEVIKFSSPVTELKSFYYYELTFPPTTDTFAIYIEDEAFPIVLAKIIRDWDLISKNELNKNNVARFISQYYGGPALTAKIKSIEDYLNDTRYFNEQVKRDRTKPVSIINDRVIMQDGVKIGLIVVDKKYTVTDRPASIAYNKSSDGRTTAVVTDQVITSANEIQILLVNERIVDNSKYNYNRVYENPINKSERAKLIAEKNLYQISKLENKKISSYTDQLLQRVCYLIEDYEL